MRARRLRNAWSRWRTNRRGVAAVEFALVLPMLLIVYLGGYETVQAVCAYRKLSTATVQLANVTAQYERVSSTDLSNITNASAQIMAPYPVQNLAIVLSEITTDANSVAKVTWSHAANGATALTCGSTVTLPAGISAASTSFLLVNTTYTWTPAVTWQQFSSVPMSDQIYMLPRQSSSIIYTGTGCG